MSKYHGELSKREQDLLKIRRDSDTKAAELVKMERMMQQTKNLMEKKTESSTDSMGYQENMGLYHKPKPFLKFIFQMCLCFRERWTCVDRAFWLPVTVEDLEEKVRSSRRYRRNSLHHTQMLESQMKTVKGELVGTLDHLQELRNVLRRSQQKAEERKATMEKLAAGLRWTNRPLRLLFAHRLNVTRRERSRVGFMVDGKRLELLCRSSSCSPPVFWHPET